MKIKSIDDQTDFKNKYNSLLFEVQKMRKKKLNGHEESIRVLINSLFSAIEEDRKCLLKAEGMWAKAKEMFDKDAGSGYLDSDTTFELLQMIAFIYEDERAKDEKLLDVADKISVELNKLKED